jgi:hypothetical protein
MLPAWRGTRIATFASLAQWATWSARKRCSKPPKRFATLVKGIVVRAKFGSDDQKMLADDVDFDEPIGICRTAVLMTFKNGLIASIELFYDARPFEKNLKKDAIFSSR